MACRWAVGILGLALFVPSAGFGWGLHYLVTDRSLQGFHGDTFLGSSIPVETLEHFLTGEKDGLAKLFDEYYRWLATSGSNRFVPARFPADRPTLPAFLAAARLYPGTRFAYVRRLLPASPPSKLPVSFTTLSPFEKGEKNLAEVFEESSSGETTPRAVLDTYSDEPDWMIDHDLWSYPEYGYGKIPFGIPGDRSSGAAFHMQFTHENIFIRSLAPEILHNLVAERIELFVRLSRLALRTNHPYWGSRFAAWSFHYLEDLAQPYHSVALPSAGWWFYLRYAFSFDKARFKEEATVLASNRHNLYEDFVKLLLQRSYVEDEGLPRQLAQSLERGPKAFNDLVASGDTQALIQQVTGLAVRYAKAVDRAVVRTYGPTLTEDPSVDFYTTAIYDNLAIYRRPDKELKGLAAQAARNLSLVGTATRTLWELCRK